jgi:hypothetical protein
VWLIDDTVPSDYYAAWPNQMEAGRMRQTDLGKHPEWPKSGAWQGDVFKVVFALHDFFPKMSYHTVMAGKPQTLAWRQPRDQFSPLLNSMEAIAKMSYFDFRRCEHVLRGVPEERAFEEITRVFANSRPQDAGPGVEHSEKRAIIDTSKFEDSDALALYDLESRTEETNLHGGLEWSPSAPGVAITAPGAIELAGVVAAPAMVVLRGAGAQDPLGFCDMALTFDGCELSGRFEVDETGKWKFVGTTGRQPVGSESTEDEDAQICTLAIARSSEAGFQDGLLLERISVFAPGRVMGPGNGACPIAAVFDAGYGTGSKGWYPTDSAHNGGYRWMGPVGESRLCLKRGRAYRLSIPEVRPLTADLLANLRVTLGGVPMALRVEPLRHGGPLFNVLGECVLPEGAEKSLMLVISFPEESVCSPRELGLNEDRRRITIAARRIAVAAIA